MRTNVVGIAQQISLTLQPQEPPVIQLQHDQPTLHNQEQKQARGGRKEGSQNYTPAKLRWLLNIINIQLPFGADQWQQVADEYNQKTKENRSAKSLKDKFNELVKSKKPTGEGEKSKLIEYAQRIQDEITLKFNGSVISSIPTSSSSTSSTPTTSPSTSFSFDPQQTFDESPQSSPSSPTASVASSVVETHSSSKKRKLEDAVFQIAECASKRAATDSSAALVHVVKEVLGTVERMQKQNQEWMEKLLSQSLHQHTQHQPTLVSHTVTTTSSKEVDAS